MRGFAALAFVAIFVLDVPFPLIVLAAALIGFFSGRAGYAAFKGGGGHGPAGAEIIHDRDTALGEGLPDHARPNLSWSLRISGVLLLLWLGPVAALLFAFGPDDVFSRIATFRSEEHTSELQSLMRISYDVFCLKHKNTHTRTR